MTDLTLRAGFSVLVGLAITAGVAIAIREYRSACYTRDGSVSVSLSAIGPNLVTYILLAPWWAIVYQAVAAVAPVTLPLTIATFAMALIACDLSYYIEHRCGHRVRLMWKLHHGTHHSAEVFNIPLAYRVNFANQFISPVFYVPWLLLGLNPLVVLGFQLFVFHYQAWIHTETVGQLGWIDRVFNTPANHRMHHSRNPSHKDVNLGGVFMLWDHLFGTYRKPEDRVSYGVADTPPSTTYLGIYLDPWKRS